MDAKSFTGVEGEDVVRQMGKKLLSFGFFDIAYFMVSTTFPIVKKIYQLPLIPKQVEAFFTNLMSMAVKFRLDNKIERTDYLDHLLQLKKKKNISDLDIAAHGVTFFLDGFETSSNVMSFMLYTLGAHKDVQDRLRQEIIDNSDENGNISYEKIDVMPYIEQVLSETLRLYPPISMLTKKCTNSTYLTGYKGQTVKIEHGTNIAIPLMSIHWDSRNYDDPMTFDPDRFAPEKGGTKKFEEDGKFLGFGMGPRICLGRRFAKAQLKIGIAGILKNFEILIDEKMMQPIVLDPKEIFSHPVGGTWINFKRL